MDGFQKQYLAQGKLLTGKSFPNFVRTWNWLVNFCANLSGDADNLGDGKIEVDRSNADHPVIRITTRGNGGSSSSGEATPTWQSGRFRLSAISSASVKVADCAIVASGAVYSADSVTLDVDSSAGAVYVYAEVTIGSTATIAIKAADTWPAWHSDDYTTVRYPLYTISKGEVTCDWRIGPSAAVYV